MKDIIIIHGAPGCGKTSTCQELQKQLDYPPYLELDRLRQFHVDPEWKKASLQDERMALLNMIGMTKNYLDQGYKNLIVSHLREGQLVEFIKSFSQQNYIIISIVVSNDGILKQRVLCPTRDSGFRDYEESIDRNKKISQREILKNEHRIDNTHSDVQTTVSAIMQIVN